MPSLPVIYLFKETTNPDNPLKSPQDKLSTLAKHPPKNVTKHRLNPQHRELPTPCGDTSSNLKPQTSNLKPRTSNLEPRTSNLDLSLATITSAAFHSL